MKAINLFIIFDIEFVNEQTGQLVTLTTTCGNYRELGKYLTVFSAIKEHSAVDEIGTLLLALKRANAFSVTALTEHSFIWFVMLY